MFKTSKRDSLWLASMDWGGMVRTIIVVAATASLWAALIVCARWVEANHITVCLVDVNCEGP